jgi:PRTRC genetic system protein E
MAKGLTMFTEIEALLKQTTLLLTIAKTLDGLMQVTVTPKCKDGEAAGLNTPMVLKGTAGELDTEFVELVSSYTASRLSLKDQLAAAEAVMTAAKAAASKSASKANAGATRKSPASGRAKSTPAATSADEDGDDGERSSEAIAATIGDASGIDKTQESLFD